jgi:hypothetical protein
VTARALSHYSMMAREALQRPLRCVECGGVAFACPCVTARPVAASAAVPRFRPCKGCPYPEHCMGNGCDRVPD